VDKSNRTRSSNEDFPAGLEERANYMLGDIVRLANNLWLVAGDISVDIPNVLVYLAAHDRLYLMDSAAGPTIRTSIIRVLNEAGSTKSFTLLNSSTADYCCISI
jgi:hypothetical protein